MLRKRFNGVGEFRAPLLHRTMHGHQQAPQTQRPHGQHHQPAIVPKGHAELHELRGNPAGSCNLGKQSCRFLRAIEGFDAGPEQRQHQCDPIVLRQVSQNLSKASVQVRRALGVRQVAKLACRAAAALAGHKVQARPAAEVWMPGTAWVAPRGRGLWRSMCEIAEGCGVIRGCLGLLLQQHAGRCRRRLESMGARGQCCETRRPSHWSATAEPACHTPYVGTVMW
mmetsp:Transcript_68970/g.223598  ORF Transcript_68970/g.223598 Transcript_68970/m.223598 type:complete len:225 (-) Transcript_68970:485-1159(-)